MTYSDSPAYKGGRLSCTLSMSSRLFFTFFYCNLAFFIICCVNYAGTVISYSPNAADMYCTYSLNSPQPCESAMIDIMRQICLFEMIYTPIITVILLFFCSFCWYIFDKQTSDSRLSVCERVGLASSNILNAMDIILVVAFYIYALVTMVRISEAVVPYCESTTTFTTTCNLYNLGFTTLYIMAIVKETFMGLSILASCFFE